VAERVEHQAHAGGIPIGKPAAYLQAEAGLAAPWRPDQRDQPDALDQLEEVAGLGLTADQRRQQALTALNRSILNHYTSDFC